MCGHHRVGQALDVLLVGKAPVSIANLYLRPSAWNSDTCPQTVNLKGWKYNPSHKYQRQSLGKVPKLHGISTSEACHRSRSSLVQGPSSVDTTSILHCPELLRLAYSALASRRIRR